MLIAFVPGYAAIGPRADRRSDGRLLQGFSAGVELGGVSVYLSEMATPRHKGFYVSWQSASQQLAIVVAAALGYAITVWMLPATVTAWGWRIPFFIGCLIVPIIYLLRSSLLETEAFLARTRRPEACAILRSLVEHWSLVVAGALLVVMTTVSFYLITVYTPTFAHGPGRPHESFIVTFCVGVSNSLAAGEGVVDRTAGARSLPVRRAHAVDVAWIVSCLLRPPSQDAPPNCGCRSYASYNGAMVVSSPR